MPVLSKSSQPTRAKRTTPKSRRKVHRCRPISVPGQHPRASAIASPAGARLTKHVRNDSQTHSVIRTHETTNRVMKPTLNNPVNPDDTRVGQRTPSSCATIVGRRPIPLRWLIIDDHFRYVQLSFCMGCGYTTQSRGRGAGLLPSRLRSRPSRELSRLEPEVTTIVTLPRSTNRGCVDCAAASGFTTSLHVACRQGQPSLANSPLSATRTTYSGTMKVRLVIE